MDDAKHAVCQSDERNVKRVFTFFWPFFSDSGAESRTVFVNQTQGDSVISNRRYEVAAALEYYWHVDRPAGNKEREATDARFDLVSTCTI
jgi:hypothetical protein